MFFLFCFSSVTKSSENSVFAFCKMCFYLFFVLILGTFIPSPFWSLCSRRGEKLIVQYRLALVTPFILQTILFLLFFHVKHSYYNILLFFLSFLVILFQIFFFNFYAIFLPLSYLFYHFLFITGWRTFSCPPATQQSALDYS